MKKLIEKIHDKWRNSQSFIFWSVLICMIFLLFVYGYINNVLGNSKLSFEDSEDFDKTIETSLDNEDFEKTIELETSVPTRMDILKEMYHKNSRDIIVAVDVLFNYGGSLVKSDIKTTYSYLSTYDVNTEYDYSDERFDLEVDAFVYIFKDELMLDEVTKELVLKRQFILNEMKNMEE